MKSIIIVLEQKKLFLEEERNPLIVMKYIYCNIFECIAKKQGELKDNLQ